MRFANNKPRIYGDSQGKDAVYMVQDKEGMNTCNLIPDAWAVSYSITDLPFSDRCLGIRYFNCK